MILGKKNAASGLEDILVEANVFSPNAGSVIMNGGNYKRCTLAHCLMYETICRLEWKKDLLEETMHPSLKRSVKECSRK